MKLESLLGAMDAMHRDVQERVTKTREAQINRHNRRTHVRKCNFDLSDFILRSFGEKTERRKLSFCWRGPFRVTKVLSDFLYEVEDLRSGKKSTTHGTRLKCFRNKDLLVTTDLLEQLAFQDGEYCVVETLIVTTVHEGETQILVVWRGFKDEDPA